MTSEAERVEEVAKGHRRHRHTCPHCGNQKAYPMALCSKCCRFGNCPCLADAHLLAKEGRDHG